jgi:hypothetical protein
VSKALQIIEEKLPATTLRDEILNFIRTSEIGIIKRHLQNGTDEDIAF